MLPRRKFTWASSADSTAVLLRRSENGQHKDSRPTSRASFAGRRSSLNILSEVKEVTTPLQSPSGLYERIEMSDVLKLGGGRDGADGGALKDPEETEPNSETASFRDVEVTSATQPSTTSTVLPDKDDRFFSYDVVGSVTPTQAEVHASPSNGAADFHVESPGRLIRATDSLEPDTSSDKRGQSFSANTRF